MASRVQNKQNSSTGTSISITLDAAPTENNWLVAFVAQQGTRTLTVNSGAGWSEAHAPVTNADTGTFYIKKAGAGESATQTPCTSDSSSAVWSVIMAEYTGLPASAVIEGTSIADNDNDATKTSTSTYDPPDSVQRIIIGAAFSTTNCTWSDQKVNGATTSVTELGDAGTGSGSNQTSGTMWDKIETTVTGSYTVEAVASVSATGTVFLLILKTTSGQTVAVGLNSETDTAQAMTRRKAKAAGIQSETDTAQTIARQKIKVVNLNSGTDNALSLAISKHKAIEIDTETNTALPVAPRKEKAIGQTEETDTALPIAQSKTKAIGLPTETEAALSITPRKIVQIGIASETDTALGITTGGGQTVILGIASETNNALAVAKTKQKSIVLVSESESALSITPVKRVTLGQAVETDLAQSLFKQKVITVGVAQEVNTALLLGSAPIVVELGIALETDVLLPIVFVTSIVSLTLHPRSTALHLYSRSTALTLEEL